MDRAKAEEAGQRLVDSHAAEDPFAAAIKATRMPMLITDARQPDNPIIFCNDAFLDLTGYDRDEIIGRNCRFLQGPDTDRGRVDLVREAVRNEEPLRVDLLNYRKDGRPFWNALYLSPVKDIDGTTIFFFASQLDVTEIKDKEARLESARAEREQEVRDRTAELRTALEARTVLLHEVDHRVKNNLLMIASLVKLQARRSGSATERGVLMSVLKRVEALSTVQRKLFVLDDVSRFDVAEFARDLVEDLVRGARHPSLTVELDLSPVLVPASKASPLALIVNELVTDAIGHAARDEGLIQVTVKRLNGHFLVRVADDGVGEPGAELGPDSFGRLVVETCAAQLRADVRWTVEDGRTVAEVRLAVEETETSDP